MPDLTGVFATSSPADAAPSHGQTPAASACAQGSAGVTSAASTTEEQKPKRIRTSKPKVKTGCKNCKQRRIKCDEKRPACTQCVRSKKECTGYPPPARSARPHEVVNIAPKPGQLPLVATAARPVHTMLPPRRATKLAARRPTLVAPAVAAAPPPHRSSMILYRPTMCLPFENQVDAMYFQLFRTQTSSELSGFFDSVFWTRTVLQECHAERPVMHAVIALGALYKTLEKRSKSPPGSPSQTPDGVDGAVAHWQVAVGQYQNSVKALLNVNSRDQGSNRTRLIATVLLACFDSFAGDHEQAITQIQSGLGLLEQMRQERRMAFHTGSEEPVEPELIQMFTRLAIQAKSYDMAFHFPQPYVIRLTPATSEQPGSSPSDAGSPASALPEIPERFSSLIEARLAWDNLCERMIRFNERLFSYQSPDSPMGILPPHLTTYGLGFKQQIEQWAVAFEPLLASRNAPGVSSQEKTARAILKMFQLMGHILFLMTFSASEMHFDNFHLFFKAIVDLGMEVVGDEERRAAAKRCPNPQTCVHRDTYAAGPGEPMLGPEFTACHIKPSFSADLGIVPPLYVVATKCRNSLLRRQAIQLLRSSARREGMWDSELTARIAMWIASIEEDASEDAQKPGSQLQMQQPAPVPYIKTEDFSSQGAFAGSTDGGSGFSTRHSSHSPTPPPTGPANSATPSIKSESQTSVSGLDSPPPSASFGATSPLQPAYHRQTPDFAENVPLGPGGNARWDAEAAAMLKAQRRYAAAATMAMAGSVSPGGCGPAAVDSYSVVPEHRRVMVRAVRFSLRSRVAEIECGTRGLPAGAFDERARKTRIQW